MNTTCCKSFAIACSIVSFDSIATTFTDPIDGMLDMGEYLAENAYGFLPIPIIITEPAIGYGGGFAGMFLHETETQRENRKQLALQSLEGGAQLIPPAVTIAGGAATENGTWFALIGHRRVWKEDSIRYLGGIGAGKAVMDFYPFANAAGDIKNLGLQIETEGVGGIQKLQFRIPDTSLFLGVQQFYANSEVHVGSIVPEPIKVNKSTTSGLGVNLEYDAKN